MASGGGRKLLKSAKTVDINVIKDVIKRCCEEHFIDINENLEPQRECCIYKVPTDLCRINEEAYTPQVISIGPLHYGEYEEMEKQKIRYLREFDKRISLKTSKELVTFIEMHEQSIRNYYQEMPKFEKDQFITMILSDAIFIIEFFMRWKDDSFEKKTKRENDLKRKGVTKEEPKSGRISMEKEEESARKPMQKEELKLERRPMEKEELESERRPMEKEEESARRPSKEEPKSERRPLEEDTSARRPMEKEQLSTQSTISERRPMEEDTSARRHIEIEQLMEQTTMEERRPIKVVRWEGRDMETMVTSAQTSAQRHRVLGSVSAWTSTPMEDVMDTNRKGDFLLDNPRLEAAIRMDLQLLENQLPYFILEGLYGIAFPKPKTNEGEYLSFFEYTCAFFSDHMLNATLDQVEIKHFVDLRRNAITRTYPRPKSKENTDLLASALKLQESGVQFSHTEGRGLLDIKFKKKKLQIPRFTVDDWTERLIRNVMAFEQCKYPSETHVGNYISLMDNLINTKEDVDLLVEADIISNQVGDTARIAKMFNDLCLQITLSRSGYLGTIKALNTHYQDPWNHAMATLKSVYFTNYWRGTATVAAIVLLLLTFIQTLCSILQVL